MASPSSPNAGPSPADAKPPHPTLMGVAQAVAFFDRAGQTVDAQAFYDWAAMHWDTDKYERAFENVEKHLGEQTTAEADLEAAHQCIVAAVKAAGQYKEETLTEDEHDELRKVLDAYRERKKQREGEAAGRK
ncbi:hypothetical protein LTR85_004399 [Meristemomyces frigidus]|nr:hypothetical protein LTR85_004399 [Meristemomyces frigidus]